MSRILIIEDDPAIMDGMVELLKTEFYQVICSNDGNDGLQKALTELPDLILLDVNLPGMNGFEVCRKLRENNYNSPVLMFTSRSEQMDKIIGLELGADDYIIKPFDPRELLARIHSHLRSKEREKKSNPLSKRRLLTILFSDIKDYSKTMNENEELGIKLLGEHNKILRSKFKEYNGHIVENSGDAFLSTFESALEAVQCSVDIQKFLCIYNKNHPPKEKIEVRISIHLGDVLYFENGIKGDSVNVTARIQAITPPGSIYLSEQVYKAVKNKTDLKFENAGTFSLKNINEQVPVYKIVS